MSEEIFFIDTNIVMYAVGGEHVYKSPCASIIIGIADGSFARNVGIPVTDTEVFQEILYRYALIGRWESGILICKHFMNLGLKILSVEVNEVSKMITLAEGYRDKGIPPRDLLHLAVMLDNSITNVVSVDSHFDLTSEVSRIKPEDISF